METANAHLNRRIKNHLLLRGSSDFANEAEYVRFVDEICAAANRLRIVKVEEERRHLRPLPTTRYPESEQIAVSVSSASTVRVKKNTYSVPAKLIGLKLDAHVAEADIRFTHEGREVCRCPRAQGQKPRIDYRHVVTWLVRKPGAFRGYLYRQRRCSPRSFFARPTTRLLTSGDRPPTSTICGSWSSLPIMTNARSPTSSAPACGAAMCRCSIGVRSHLNTSPAPLAEALPLEPDLGSYDSLLKEASA